MFVFSAAVADKTFDDDDLDVKGLLRCRNTRE
jgi:hypothetical protein